MLHLYSRLCVAADSICTYLISWVEVVFELQDDQHAFSLGHTVEPAGKYHRILHLVGCEGVTFAVC